ncbi:hypothetical protein EAF04_004473 [Stromatinia cepivora]|nr:hypothetical protein EAF04_004473 [Stromatinia cepivora]
MPYYSSISDTMWMCCHKLSQRYQGCGTRNKMKLKKCEKCAHEKCNKCTVMTLEMIAKNIEEATEYMKSQ